MRWLLLALQLDNQRRQVEREGQQALEEAERLAAPAALTPEQVSAVQSVQRYFEAVQRWVLARPRARPLGHPGVFLSGVLSLCEGVTRIDAVSREGGGVGR